MMTPEQAAQLRDRGEITPEQHDQIVGRLSIPSMNPMSMGMGVTPPEPTDQGLVPIPDAALPTFDPTAGMSMNSATSEGMYAPPVTVAPPPSVAPVAPLTGPPVSAKMPSSDVVDGNGAKPAAQSTAPVTESAPASVGNNPFGSDVKTTTYGISKAAQKALEDSHVESVNALTAASALETEQAKAHAADITARRQLAENSIAAEEAARAEQESTIRSKQEEIAGQVRDFQNAKLDPNRIWSNASTGNKIQAGVAMLLGIWGQALAGGENQALTAIDKAINADIDAQKFNMDKQGKGIQMNQTVYQDMRQRFGDERIARSAMREMAYGKLAMDLEGKLAATSDQTIASRLQTNIAAMNEKAATEKANQEKWVREVTPKVAPKSLINPTDRVLQKPEDEEMAGYESTVKAAVKLNDMLEKVPDDQMGPLDSIVNRIRNTVGLEVDERYIAAAQAGNLLAKAYLHSVSGSGVTDKELERTLDTILTDMKLNPATARARVKGMAENAQAQWNERAPAIIANVPGDPRVRTTLQARQPKLPWEVKKAATEAHRPKQ